ncbi:MAG: hypothetical protein IH991_06940 [Planctomycetes bacterium]|nr:hypothetical protein [Planctomycetota bacterium]
MTSRRQKQPFVISFVCVVLLWPALAGAAEWSKDFHLRDYMRIYDFPDQLVSYDVAFPPKTVRRDGLSLTALHGDQPQATPFQLSDVAELDGFVVKATLSFRTDLPKGMTRHFRLEFDSKRKAAPASSRVGIVEHDGETAILAANRLRVRVPFGGKNFEREPVALSKVPAPILAIARGEKPNAWCLVGSLQAADTLKVIAMQAGLVEEGPLFAKYRVVYTFNRGQQYTVVLTLRHNDRHLTIDETFGGIQPSDEAFLRIDFTKEFDPDQREVMSNGGYGAQGYCGAFDKNVAADGKLPFELGLNRPNSMGVMRSAAFVEEKGEHSLLVSLYRLRDWKTVYRHVWYSNTGPGNLNFYARDGKKFLQTRLEGTERHWALALIPRDEHKHVRNTPGGRGRGPAGGPEVRLWQKLADFDLDRVKDWVFEWDERVDARMFPKGNKVSYEVWLKAYGLDAPWWFLNAIVNFYWDFSAEVGPPSYGLMPGFFGDYERSRADWTEEQRKHVRAILLFLAYTAEDDNNLPHHSMMAGQPNFVMQVKQTVPTACGVFPNHPHAKQWRDSFEKFYNEWLEVYGRPTDVEHNAMGGRWTENIACYSGTSLQASLRCAKGLEIYDGTDLLKNPLLHDWVRFHLNSLMSPHNGARRVPPEGAHAGAFAVGGAYWNDLFEIARRLKTTNPALSAKMRWIESGGKEGTNPALKSVLIRDYGPVLRHDFGGPREAYLHLMQTSGRYNYRWGPGSGVLYYGAKNKNWSYNGAEQNGDNFDINLVTSFSVAGQSLGYHPTDQPLFDFEFAQWYRAVADPRLAAKTKYRSRGIMMLRDDYIVVYDDVDGTTEGQFTWSSGGQSPQIYQLKPGVRLDKESTEQVTRYKGQGDFLTIVAPQSLKAKSASFGGLVNDSEYVFWRDAPFEYSQGGVQFQGTVGYARENQLALFEGTMVSRRGFELRRSGGDFGVSAAVSGKQIVGRIAGRKGGRVSIKPAWRFEPKNVAVRVDGRQTRAMVAEGTVSFDVAISLKDGSRQFEITFSK